MMRLHVAGLLALLLLTSGCGRYGFEAHELVRDGGADAELLPDSTLNDDSGAMLDAGHDGGLDASVDAEVDAQADAGFDASADAQVDAPEPTDAGSDAPIDFGVDAEIEMPDVVVSLTTGNTTTEFGGSVLIDVVLGWRPSADVQVNSTSTDATEGVATPASLIFTAENWDTPQVVTVSGVDDLLTDGDSMYSVHFTVTSTDAAYDGFVVDDLALVNLDNDTPGVTISPQTGLMTEEAGTATSFTVQLDTQPASDVTISFASDDPSEGTVTPASLTFTLTNWSTPQVVLVTGVDDDMQDGDQDYAVVSTGVVTSDPNYDSVVPPDVHVTNLDDDTANILISDTASLTTTEFGDTASFTIRLATRPTASVIIPIESADTSEDTVSAAFVLFSTANWATPQTVTLTGVNDAFADGDQTTTITLGPVSSGDANYAGIALPSPSVINLDNDTAGYLVTPTSGLVTSESGATASFTVRLNTMPTASVTISLASSDLTEGTVSPSSIMFNTVNWATPRPVTVTGVFDAALDGDQPYTVIINVSGTTDTTYAAINPSDVSVTNIDTSVCGGMMCGGSCVSCPTGPRVASTGCSGAMCVITACRPWYSLVSGACVQSAYVKASNTQTNDGFGGDIALSGDGNTLAVRSSDASAATGINGDALDNSAPGAGGVHVYRRSGAMWALEAYIKASNTEANDAFGTSIGISADGNVLVVGSPNESSNATGVGGNQANNATIDAGAAYVFRRSGATWAQEAYVKGSIATSYGLFGYGVAISGDGDTFAASATNQSSVYTFKRTAGVWAQQARIPMPVGGSANAIGYAGSMSLSSDGTVLAFGAWNESSGATGINGDFLDRSAMTSGAAYVYRWGGAMWALEAYIKASNTDPMDAFGTAVALSADGNVLAVSALYERSTATGIGGNQADNTGNFNGAVYVFTHSGPTWIQEAYVKAATPTTNGLAFGAGVSLSSTGTVLAVGATIDSSGGAYYAGSAYVFRKSAGIWAQESIVTGDNSQSSDGFAFRVDLSDDGNRLACGAPGEDSNATGVDGNAADNSASSSGAVYVFDH